MNPIIPNTMIVFIVGSLCCALIGGVMTAIRTARLVRSGRRREYSIQVALEIAAAKSQKVDVRDI